VTDAAWRVEISAAADADFQQIIIWTGERCGPDQARAYADTLSAALLALRGGPRIAGVQTRDIGRELYTLHVARNKRRGRHFVLFRVGTVEDNAAIQVLRLLHDAMDLARHAPAEDQDGKR
jgi:toxin ParE1/3/4